LFSCGKICSINYNSNNSRYVTAYKILSKQESNLILYFLSIKITTKNITASR